MRHPICVRFVGSLSNASSDQLRAPPAGSHLNKRSLEPAPTRWNNLLDCCIRSLGRRSVWPCCASESASVAAVCFRIISDGAEEAPH
jgi:hypothetical protein